MERMLRRRDMKNEKWGCDQLPHVSSFKKWVFFTSLEFISHFFIK